MQHPISLLETWIKEEQDAGAQYAQHAILATSDKHSQPRSRVIAIREITDDRLLLFTQKGTQKVADIQTNHQVSLTFWFELHAREVMIEGNAVFLSDTENESYWAGLPKNAQVRFCAYAPTSGQQIEHKQVLEDKKAKLEMSFADSPVPVSEAYCGIAIQPQRFVFYTYRLDELSDVWEARKKDGQMTWSTLSP